MGQLFSEILIILQIHSYLSTKGTQYPQLPYNQQSRRKNSKLLGITKSLGQTEFQSQTT